MPLQCQFAVGLQCDENLTKNRCHHNIAFPLGGISLLLWKDFSTDQYVLGLVDGFIIISINENNISV